MLQGSHAHCAEQQRQCTKTLRHLVFCGFGGIRARRPENEIRPVKAAPDRLPIPFVVPRKVAWRRTVAVAIGGRSAGV